MHDDRPFFQAIENLRCPDMLVTNVTAHLDPKLDQVQQYICDLTSDQAIEGYRRLIDIAASYDDSALPLFVPTFESLRLRVLTVMARATHAMSVYKLLTNFREVSDQNLRDDLSMGNLLTLVRQTRPKRQHA
jgi:hypothetical protein